MAIDKTRRVAVRKKKLKTNPAKVNTAGLTAPAVCGSTKD